MYYIIEGLRMMSQLWARLTVLTKVNGGRGVVIPRNKYPEETKAKILAASRQLFIEKGFEQTTVLDIVANLEGLTRGAFYHHFKSKEELMEAIINNYAETRAPLVRLKNDQGLNGLQKVKQLIKYSMIDDIKGREEQGFINMVISLLDNPRFLAEHLKSNREISRDVAHVIEEGMADGSIRQGNPLVLAELLMIIMNFWFMPSIYPFDNEMTDDKIKAAAEMLETVGMPVFDEEVIQMMHNFAEKLGWKSK